LAHIRNNEKRVVVESAYKGIGWSGNREEKKRNDPYWHLSSGGEE